MQNMTLKITSILLLLGLFLAVIVVKEPSLGRDLRGGVSLTYAVEISDDEPNPEQVLQQTITVLKDRVNPTGVLDLQMQPMGRNRIEIAMPLPNAEVRAMKVEAEAELGRLLQRSAIDRFALRASLVDGTSVERFGGEAGTPRAESVAALQAAYDERELRATELDAMPADANETAQIEAAQDFALAQVAYDKAERTVLDRSLDEGRLRRILSLSDEPEPEKDPVTGRNMRDDDGKIVFGDSAREAAITGLKGEYPSLATDLDTVVAAYRLYEANVTGYDDPEDLQRLLRGAGVLDFRIAVRSSTPEAGVDVDDMRTQLDELGPVAATSAVARWYPVNRLDQWYEEPQELLALEADPSGYFATRRDLVAAEHDGQIYMLLYTTRAKSLAHDQGTAWALESAGRTVDQLGRPAVLFGLDATGATGMGRLTAGNINEPMAIVLDGEVYTAPNINSQITSSGTIVGQFTAQDIDYLIRVLSAGSLSASLGENPISVSVLGPSLGADNLARGKEAFIIAIIAVAVFMMAYYLLAGVVAVMALVANGIVIFGVLIGIDGTFTLPGLAGIVLTIGMAVDANVLIYERIREEMFAGELDLRGCVRQGYGKALSTILDANVTNLIVCIVLFYTATTEVKGFALTLSLGICATLFTALFMTRQIFLLYTDGLKKTSLPMLPVVFPAIHRALEPNINWLGKRHAFRVVSVIAITGSLILVSSRGVEMLDTEFRGGVSLKIQTTPIDADGDGAPDIDDQGRVVRNLIRHTGEGGVETRIRAIGDRAAELAGGDAVAEAVLGQFSTAQVLTVGRTGSDDDGSITSGEFQVKIAAPSAEAVGDADATITDTVVDAIVNEFGDEVLDVNPTVIFDGAGADDSTPYARPITDAQLGRNVDRRDVSELVPEFVGGTAIVLESISPPITEDEILRRIGRTREQPDFREFAGRRLGVVPLMAADPENPQAGLTAAILMVHDPALEYTSPSVDPQAWRSRLADPEFQIVSVALGQPRSLDEVSSFSSSVAQTLKANATVAVILSLLGILSYIWVRFGSLRYSLAAIAALVHDVIIALGLLALSGIIGTTAIGQLFLIEPFRIDLGVVAAMLTIIGYSLNDTIVILDRIRENRGKLPVATEAQVNLSINQTVSRTLLTSVTTVMAVAIMYAEGGSGIRPFTFCLLAGLFVGTYSSIAIAAPLVFARGDDSGKSTGSTARDRGPIGERDSATD